MRAVDRRGARSFSKESNVFASGYLSNDLGSVDLHATEDRILTGVRSIIDEADAITSCPFSIGAAEETVDIDSFKHSFTMILAGRNCPMTACELHTDCEIVASTSECENAHGFIANELVGFANSLPDRLSKAATYMEIGDVWVDTKSRIDMIKTAFSPLCVRHKRLEDFEEVFSATLTRAWAERHNEFREIASKILVAYAECRESGDMKPVTPAFLFARESGVFHDVFVAMFTGSVKEYLKPTLDTLFGRQLKEYLSATVTIGNRERELARSLIDDDAMNELTSAINRVAFTERLDDICNGLKVLVEECDDDSVDLCASYARATDKISHFTRELSFEVERAAEECFKSENPIQEVLKVHGATAKFCARSFQQQQHSRTIQIAFEKGLNTSPDVVSRLLAEEIHRKFVTEWSIPQEMFDHYISVFRILSGKDVFEAYHHLLMSRRILMMKNHIIQSDKTFLAELREQCGPEYTKRFDAIFSDLEKSIETVTAFRSERHPSPMVDALVLHREAWPQLEVTGRLIAIPEIERFLTEFSVFFVARHGKRKLQWNLAFTRVRLEVRNVPNVTEIHCSGLYALLLLQFNTIPILDLAQLAARTGMPEDQIETCMKILSSKQFGRLVIFMHRRWRLNTDNSVEHTDLSIPFTFPSLPKTEDTAKSTVQQNRANQIDGAVMFVMKRERSMEKGELKSQVKERLNFRLDDELYETRLVHLEKISYLKLDPSGHVHYLP